MPNDFEIHQNLMKHHAMLKRQERLRDNLESVAIALMGAIFLILLVG